MIPGRETTPAPERTTAGIRTTAAAKAAKGPAKATAKPLVAQIETEIVSAAPVQAGGGYTLHFSQYNGGRAEIRTAPDTEPVTGLFGKEPGKEQFEVLFGEEDYVCSPASYTDEEGERKIVREVDLTEQYQALYPAAGITRAVRREYTSANAY